MDQGHENSHEDDYDSAAMQEAIDLAYAWLEREGKPRPVRLLHSTEGMLFALFTYDALRGRRVEVRN